jgi:hypothetical protein
VGERKSTVTPLGRTRAWRFDGGLALAIEMLRCGRGFTNVNMGISEAEGILTWGFIVIINLHFLSRNTCILLATKIHS